MKLPAPSPHAIIKEVDKHLIYLEAALKAETAELPPKLRQDLLQEVKAARKVIHG